MKVAIVDINGKETGRTVALDKAIFGVEPNEHALYLDVKQYLAHQRQGTHKAKERAEIVGSTRKIKRQKGTGTARAGSIKNPLFRGGGRVFGPRVRAYNQKVNKNVKRLARKSAFSLKAQQKNITVVEDFQFDAPKTKSFQAALSALGITDKKINLGIG
jgi:large subunit ribosomal protein L4